MSNASPEFNDVEHIQSAYRKLLNPQIRDYFNDLVIDDNWEPDVRVPRQSLAAACLHKDTDNLTTTLTRYNLFSEIRGQEYRTPILGWPLKSIGEDRVFKPQVILIFKEDSQDVEPGYSPVLGRISFRLSGVTSTTITEGNLNTYATRIKQEFASPASGFLWRKGSRMFSYSDWAKGYQLQLLVRSESDGREIVNKVLDIQGDTPDWSKANYSQNESESQAYPVNPGTTVVLGKSRKKTRKRPIAIVRFQYASCLIAEVGTPIILCDRSHNYPQALQRTY